MATAMAIHGNLEGLDAGVFKRDARNYDVVVKLADRDGTGQIRDFAFRGPAGHPLVLESLARVSRSRAPVQITRKNKRRIAMLYANLAPALPLGTAVDKISRELESQGLPPGYDYNFAGQYEVMAEGNAGFAEAMLISVVLVVLTLAAIMESFRQAGLILVTLPLALVGTIWALFVTGESFGMFVIMGMVIMIGIVVNNAILIMDQLNVHLDEGVPRHKAMITAACDRFRPIVMITLAAVCGMLPLALGRGIGAELRNGVGIASAGGILVSGVLTVLVLPVLYDFITPRGKGQETANDG
jgi:HAE1 family hydrophobic/amphiphilic exporter-1